MKRKVIFTLFVLAVSTVGLLACSSNAGDAESVTNEVIETEEQQEIGEEPIVEGSEDIEEEQKQDVADIEKDESDQNAAGVEEELGQDVAGDEEKLDQDVAGDEEKLDQDVADIEEDTEQQVVEEPTIQDDGRGNGAGEGITESEANYFAEAEALWAEHSSELVVNWETFREVYAYERSTGLSQEEVYNELYEMFK